MKCRKLWVLDMKLKFMICNTLYFPNKILMHATQCEGWRTLFSQASRRKVREDMMREGGRAGTCRTDCDYRGSYQNINKVWVTEMNRKDWEQRLCEEGRTRPSLATSSLPWLSKCDWLLTSFSLPWPRLTLTPTWTDLPPFFSPSQLLFQPLSLRCSPLSLFIMTHPLLSF